MKWEMMGNNRKENGGNKKEDGNREEENKINLSKDGGNRN